MSAGSTSDHCKLGILPRSRVVVSHSRLRRAIPGDHTVTVADITGHWQHKLADWLRTPPPLAVGSAPPGPRRPVLPFEDEWRDLRYDFELMSSVLNGLGQRGVADVPHRSVVVTPELSPRYRMVSETTHVAGRLYLLECPGTPPFSAHLRRFVAFVPASYTRTGTAGHFAWVHYPPSWVPGQPPAPRYLSAAGDYPESIWFYKFLGDYLLTLMALTSFHRSGLDAILFLPVYRFTNGNALAPLGDTRTLLGILTHLCAFLETADVRLRARTPAAAGTVEGVGVSGYSSGARFCAAALRAGQPRSTFTKLRAAAFLDGAPDDGHATLRSVVGGAGGPGFLDMDSDSPPTFARHVSMYQQSNPGRSDLVSAAQGIVRGRSAVSGRMRRGETVYLLGHDRAFVNELAFHWVDTAELGRTIGEQPQPGANGGERYHFWHRQILTMFLESAMAFSRHGFR